MQALTAWARFDDLRAGVACRFQDVAYDLVATRPEHVPEVLAEVGYATRSGWWAFGFVCYEAAAGLDPSLAVHQPVEGLPLAWFGISAGPDRVPVVQPSERREYRVGEWQYEWGPGEHRRAVDAVRRHIAAGDTYQCNLTTRMSAEVSGDLLQLYADLAHAQGGAYNAYLDTGQFVIASASPELFFETRGDSLLMRPMKGTSRRGRSAAEDREIVARLRSSEKERAENIMIVDLVRNDLARLATTGGVSVRALCRAERYKTVHQLTSEVTARLRPDVDLVDVFRALFPCGSVTGAPKPSAMEIIRALEPTPRGVYCGSAGVVSPVGTGVRARFNVGIRTLLVDRDRGTAGYGTGGGITWDSTAEAEYAELRAKAAVLAAARGAAGPSQSSVEVESFAAPEVIGATGRAAPLASRDPSVLTSGIEES
ncbi:aminodeoxychorismate synthase component I [Saccharopolyspora sp. K220]|uniref:aminodeoxychorismate synthase component I n=1 Tax=Saccharopolyspora soli TaxID=2926618 RepID=UPI001F5A2FB8|nr:aminodeoxychorismate synthase component I [Saccharopolyspora soli]MCI2419251.1 aminodeoxychorismate synthase component I [Saccharopolyspora soli]